MAWAGHERLALGLTQPPPATPVPSEDEWLDLRPRWPLTSELHPRATVKVPKARRFRPKRSKMPHVSLSDCTAAALAAGTGFAPVLRPIWERDGERYEQLPTL